MKLQLTGNKKGYLLSIPKSIIDAYGWKQGQDLKIEIAPNKSLILKEK